MPTHRLVVGVALTVALGGTWLAAGAAGSETSKGSLPEPRWTLEQRSHWSYLPPRRPAVPTVRNASWVRNPIDAFILNEVEEIEDKVPCTS
jgi:hypothetical protein